MKNRWQQLKFVWEYATHFQTDNAPPLDIIFKFVNELDKKETKTIYSIFCKTEAAQKLFASETDVLDKVKTGNFEPGTFGAEFQSWLQNNNMVDLFKFGYEGHGNSNVGKFFKSTVMEHDLIHFFMGYDTTPFGEVGVLSFGLAREWRESFATILYASFFMTLRNTFIRSKYPPDTKFWALVAYNPFLVFCRTVWEGWRLGKRGPWFMTVDWDKYLNVDLQEVKKELKLDKPPKYWNKIQPVWRKVLIQYKKYAKQKIKKSASIKRSKV